MNHNFIFHMQDFTTCHVNQVLFIYLFIYFYLCLTHLTMQYFRLCSVEWWDDS